MKGNWSRLIFFGAKRKAPPPPPCEGGGGVAILLDVHFQTLAVFRGSYPGVILLNFMKAIKRQ